LPLISALEMGHFVSSQIELSIKCQSSVKTGTVSCGSQPRKATDLTMKKNEIK